VTSCVVCEGRSTNAFLCSRCQNELRDLLNGIAIGWEVQSDYKTYQADGFLEALKDTRFGLTRLGESARHSGEKNTPLVVRLGPHPDPNRDTQWKDSPIEVHRAFHGVVATWIRHLTESRGTTFIPVKSAPVWFVGPLREGWRRLSRDYRASTRDCVEWLAHHVGAIANDEAAGELFDEVKTAVDAITNIINRPEPPRFLGPCPILLTDDYGERICNTQLTAGRADSAVQCPACKTTHEVNDLHARQVDATDAMSFTIAQLYRLILPINREYVPLRTLQHWAASGRLVPTGYEGDEPRFLLADVRELREAKAQKAPTGAAAEKYKRKAC
jgi:hypothetical protein